MQVSALCGVVAGEGRRPEGRSGWSLVALSHRGDVLVDYHETGLRTTIPEEPDVTSPNTGLRRTALVVLAVGAALGASACGAGQTSQTANQMAAVDGGSGQAGDIHVSDFQIVLPEGGEGEAKVGFVVSYTGSGFGEPVSLDRVEVDGQQVQVEAGKPLERGCSLVVSVQENAQPVGGDTVCIEQSKATLSGADELKLSQSVPATLSFSNGDEVELRAGVVAETPGPGEYTRPSETAAPSEGH